MADSVFKRAVDEVEVEKRNIETDALKHSLIRIEQAKKNLEAAIASHQKLVDSINASTFDHFNQGIYGGKVCRG